MSSFLYSHPLDNLLRSAVSLTVTTGTEETGYEVANLWNGNPAHPLKIAETSLDVVGEWATPVTPLFVASLNSNLDVAAHLQGHTSNSWGAPDIDITFGVPTVSVDGWFTSPWKNLTGLVSAKAFWRWHITGNALPVALGELWLGSAVRGIDDHLLLEGAKLDADVQTVTHVTGYGVDLTYDQGPRRESMTGSLLVTASELLLLEAWAQATRGNARPMVVVPDTDVDDAWHVKLTTGGIKREPIVPDKATAPALTRVSFGFRQTSRGLPLIDPDA